jgi:hypothetical protein
VFGYVQLALTRSFGTCSKPRLRNFPGYSRGENEVWGVPVAPLWITVLLHQVLFEEKSALLLFQFGQGWCLLGPVTGERLAESRWRPRGGTRDERMMTGSHVVAQPREF